MSKPQINLLHPDKSSIEISVSKLQSPRRSRYGSIFTASIIIAVVLGSFFIANVIIPSIRLAQNFGSESLFTQLKHLTFSGEKKLIGEPEDRINILLMGIGGVGHDGPMLSDTIILASFQPSTGKASLLSIPRDLLIPFPDGSWRKINEAYSVGLTQKNEDAGEFAARSIGSLLGTRIPYYVLVDFNGFKELIDATGGIDVYVERSFSDPLFPINIYKNEQEVSTISFSAGWQHMNGETALKFARSRHGNNGEGSDFARSKRQQKILLALKNQILNAGVLLNSITVNRLSGQFTKNIKTNIEPWQIIHLYQLSNSITTEQIIRITIDDSPNGLLVSDMVNGAFVLRPANGDFSSIQNLVNNVFNNPELIQEPARVEVLNGTKINGRATEVANLLVDRGFKIVKIGNSENQNETNTTIHDFTNGARPAALATLRVLLGAKVTTGVPSWLVPTAGTITPDIASFESQIKPSTPADFVVIIGSDSIINTSN